MDITTVALSARAVEVRGGPLAVVDVGPPDGVPVLLVPGYTGSKEDFALAVDALLERGARVVSYDQRGQHESPGPEDESAYSVAELAADLLALSDALQLSRAHLVGHSFGGLVARAAVIAEPERWASLTLLGSGPAGLTGPRVDAARALEPVLDAGGVAAVVEVLDQLAHLDPRNAARSPELVAFLRARMLGSPAAALRGMRDALLTEPDRCAELVTTGLPLLVCHGVDDDAWLPSVQADMAARLAASYAVVAGAGHSPLAEAPAATVAVLAAFWDDVERTAS